MSSNPTEGFMLNDEIQTLAASIITSLEAGKYDEGEFAEVCAHLESEAPPDNVAAFAIYLEDHAADWFSDGSVYDYTDDYLEEITDNDRVKHGRWSLSHVLSSPEESTLSVSLQRVPVECGGSFVCCALVYIEGHEPVVEWYAPFLSEADALESLRRSGYVISEEDATALPDSLIIGLWNRR